MNYNFTDRVRKVLAMAREEAIRLQHDYVGTEQKRFFRFDNGKLIFGPAPNSMRGTGQALTRRLTLERQ